MYRLCGFRSVSSAVETETGVAVVNAAKIRVTRAAGADQCCLRSFILLDQLRG